MLYPMRNTDYKKMYKRIYRIIGELTPLRADCGLLCEHACCKGDKNTGMCLFPYEESMLEIRNIQSGGRLAICDGFCDRNNRPLACRIFPFFPTIDEKGKIFVEKDYRAQLLCPLLAHSEEILFDPRFFKAIRKVGKILSKDEICREFLCETTAEIDLFYQFHAEEA